MWRKAVLSSLLLVAAAASVASADDLFLSPEFDDPVSTALEEDGEERTVFTSNGNYFIALNTTYLLLYAALFGLGLLAALALASLFSPAEETGYGYSSGHGGSGQGSGYGSAHGYRTKRSSSDDIVALQMAQLIESFKKWEVADLECQMYVACEASQTNKHSENGPLAVNVYEVMTNMPERQFIKDDFAARLKQSFDEGFGQQGVVKDPCGKKRSRCYAATKKPAY